MTEQPPRSESIPPPGASGAYGASLAPTQAGVPAELEVVADRSSSSFARPSDASLVAIIGLYFLIGGALGVWNLIQALSYAPSVSSATESSGVDGSGFALSGGFGLWWLVSAVFAAASLYAGWRILQRDERGRGLGILLAFIGIAFGLLSLSAGVSAVTLALLALNACVAWVLSTSTVFTRR